MPAASGNVQWVQPPITTGWPRKAIPTASTGQRPFSEMLKDYLPEDKPVTFSAHAVERLKQRNIILNKEDLNRLGQAVEKAAAKGAKETLVLSSDLALVVSVKNRTVITAMDKNQAQEHVFTNIDSAVLM
jgi:flagellar operon protein